MQTEFTIFNHAEGCGCNSSVRSEFQRRRYYALPLDTLPKLDLASYTPITGGRIDYVLVWLGRKSNTEHPNMQSIYSYLNTHYKRIFISKNGLAELYQHNARSD